MKFLRYTLIIIVLLFIIAMIILSHPKFGQLPKGERLAKIEKSANYHDGAFHNLENKPQFTSDKSTFTVFKEFLFNKDKDLRPSEPIANITTDLKSLPADSNYLVWFGHSSFLIQLDGIRYLVDPVFYQGSPFSFINKPFEGSNNYKPDDMPTIDYLIITHDHWDHLDYKTIKNLGDKVKQVICPLGVGQHFEYWGYTPQRIIEMDWNDKSTLASQVNIYCLPSQHFSGRLFRRNPTLWASYMIETPSMHLYLSGDGGYGKHYKDIATQFPQIDIAIMENGQYNEAWSNIHLMPQDLVKAIEDLKPTSLITQHHSKFALAHHPWYEPINNIKEASKEHGFSLTTPTIGEVIYLNRPIAD